MLIKIKKFLLRYAKKEKEGKPPKTKEVKKKTAHVLVYGFLSLFFIIGFFGSLRAIGLSHQVKDLKETVLSVKKTSQKKVTSESLDISRVQYYMNNFVYYYINYSQDNAEERKVELENYYSFSQAEETDELLKTRVLKSQRLISVTKEEDHQLALMRISYEVEGHSYQMNLAIPFQMADGLLAVVSQPYTLADDLYQGKIKTVAKKSSSEVTELSESDRESLKKFLPVFFDKYASSNKTDLKLLMKEPELMGSHYKVSEVNMTNALFYQEKGQKCLQISVVFEDTISGGKRSENFTLVVNHSENGWYVEKMYHYFK